MLASWISQTFLQLVLLVHEVVKLQEHLLAQDAILQQLISGTAHGAQA